MRRKQYDEALDKAYKDGKIKDETEAQLQSLIEQARQYYQKGNIKLATQCAQQAIEGKVNDPSAYDILARCHFDMQNYLKALEVIDAGTSIFMDNLDLYWLGARIATVGTQNYDDAQGRVNKLLELAPNNSIGYSEQIFLHLRKGDEDLAFKEIDSYVAAHPQDVGFKRGVAYDIDSYSNGCYYYDQVQNAMFIADKAYLGMFYLDGTGTAPDEKAAFFWLSKCPDIDWSGLGLCKCYLFGRGTARDVDKGIRILMDIAKPQSSNVFVEDARKLARECARQGLPIPKSFLSEIEEADNRESALLDELIATFNE